MWVPRPQTPSIFNTSSSAEELYRLFTSGPDPALSKTGSQIDRLFDEDLPVVVHRYRSAMSWKKSETSPRDQRADARKLMKACASLIELLADDSRLPPTIKAMADQIETRSGCRLSDLIARSTRNVTDLQRLIGRALLQLNRRKVRTKPSLVARNRLVRDLLVISRRYHLNKSPNRERRFINCILRHEKASVENLPQVIRTVRKAM